MNSVNSYPATRESITRLYNEILGEKKTDLSKVRFLIKQIKLIREELGILRDIVKKPLRERYYLGDFVTRGRIYDLQREEGVLKDMFFNLKGANSSEERLKLCETWHVTGLELITINKD